MINAIKKQIGQYYFNREHSKFVYPRKMVNMKDARSVGILYTLDDVQDYDTVSTFVKELQLDRKEVKALGFVKNKNLISRFLPKLSYDFISKKDINWYFKPIHTKVEDFINREFDILIDLNLQDLFPLKYISGMSKALCRVGVYSESNSDFYDLMIEARPGITVNDYLQHINHYLSVINSDEKN
jgi:hypothetical protein